MKRIFIIVLGLSSLMYADFTRSTEGVVTDTNTHLEWQDNYSDNSDVVKNTKWEEAISYCEALDLAGGSWRLPNLNEINSLVDYTIFNPAMNSVFQNISNPDAAYPFYFWSSTTQKSRDTHAWYINFNDGEQHKQEKQNEYVGCNIRCVRAGQ